MSSILTDSIRAENEYGQLLEALIAEKRKVANGRQPLPVLATGLCDGAADALYAAVIDDMRAVGEGCCLIISADERECVRLTESLKRFGIRAAFFIARDYTFYNITASHDYEHERLKVLSGILSDSYDVIVTTPDAAIGYTIPPEILEKYTLRLDMSSRIEPRELAANMVCAGYKKVDMVDGVGQFAIRGGIVDIYPPHLRYKTSDGESSGAEAVPIRIELFGDEIDRIGAFDPESQRMTVAIESAEISPAREVITTADDIANIRSAIESQIKKTKKQEAQETLNTELDAIIALGDGSLSGEQVNFVDKYISLIYPQKASLFEYFKSEPQKAGQCVMIRGASAVAEKLKGARWHMNQMITELLEGGTISGRYAEYCKNDGAFDMYLSQNAVLYVESIVQGLSGKKLSGMFGFRTKHMVSYSGNYALLREDLETYRNNGYKIVVVTENKTSATNLCDMLREDGFNAFSEVNEGDFGRDTLPRGTILIKWKDYIRGYELAVPKIVVLSTIPESRSAEASVVTTVAKRRSKKRSGAKAIMSYAELDIGDYVVHEIHGIGQYTGIESLTVAGVRRDYINIKYAGSDQLFVPVDQLDKISKYIGAHSGDGTVKLSRFGGGEWNRAKSKARAAAKDMAKELIELYASRMKKQGYAFPKDDDFQRDFEAAFEYEETASQLEAAEDIKGDMIRSTPMDRLLCGDVGFGKTEVALRAAYKAVIGGKQVAILVPTTILALQHYQTAVSRMRGFPVTVEMISRFRTPKQQAQIIRRVKRGEIDILIGTHRIVSKDMEFHDLGLVIVDEEQRFGVAQKEKLKRMTNNVDVLSLSATPIPRTLNMAMSGIRDISVLDEAPGERLPVQTYVLEDDELIIGEAIRRELRRGGQVFYMHNDIETIDSVAARIKHIVPDAVIETAHGRMDKERLEEIWNSMLHGETDILVSTSIIETGIDVPNANTLIVDNSHKLGLSQLHQLRGRVGRSSRKAYAYFTYPKDRALSDISRKRLEAIREYAEFGAGFRIAMRDLELRGAGNLLGSQQHGHLDAVGYDMYIKLLNEAVLEEKGEKVEVPEECSVSLDFSAYISDSYISSSSQRMALYKRIAMIESNEDKEDIADEMIDRYGDIPKAALNLLDISLIRAKGSHCGISSIKQDGGEIKLLPKHIDIEVWAELADIFPGKLRIMMTSSAYISYKIKKGEDTLREINKIFDNYTEIVQKNAGQLNDNDV